MLELLTIADVAAELRAVELGMNLQLRESHPEDLALPGALDALVREFAEVDAVLEHLVDRLEEVSGNPAVRAAGVCRRLRLSAAQQLLLAAAIPTSGHHLEVYLLVKGSERLLRADLGHIKGHFLDEGVRHLGSSAANLHLTILAEELVATFAF